MCELFKSNFPSGALDKIIGAPFIMEEERRRELVMKAYCGIKRNQISFSN
jgi:hypothetical protein